MKSLPQLDSPSSPASEDAGFGALSTSRGCLPLKALDVQARIEGLAAHLELTQTFVNAFPEPLEATYIFPLPDRAAVTRFRLEVAGRIVEGELKERGAARRDYDRAIRAGQRAAITEEERPGVFTLRVGNLPPGETTTVRLSLVGPLTHSAGEVTFRFPLVVAPRYIPGVPLPGESVGAGTAADTDAVPDASRITPPVLLPGFPNPVQLSLSVEVASSSLLPRDFRSSLHTILYSEGRQGVHLRLQCGERLDRDFILRFRVGEERIATALTVQPDRGGGEGTFLLTLVPPTTTAAPQPRDVAFILDRSGSMGGWKMVAARRALGRMVDTLTDADRFTVLAFDNTVQTPPGCEGGKLLPATDRNRFRAVEFLAGIDARGGTEMAQPLAQALAELTEGSSSGRQRILVLVTDGQVGNEDQLLRQLGAKAKDVRIFTLGIDQAVNAAFLHRLADLGGGHSELVESEDRLDAVMDQVHRHIGTPVLTDLHLEPTGFTFVPDSFVPARLPDLFAGTPLMLLGRYWGPAHGELHLQARDGSGQTWTTCVEMCQTANVPLASLWARGRLRDLEDRYATAQQGRDKLEKEIVAVSLGAGVLCRFTAFVAVDRTESVNPGGVVHSVVQPVEAPGEWVMKGTFIGQSRAVWVPQGPLAASAAPPSLGTPSYMAPEQAAGTTDYDQEECDLLRAPRRKARKRSPASDRAERPVDRQRALELFQALYAASTSDAAAQLGLLRSWHKKLNELHKDLLAAGDRQKAEQKLCEALQEVQVLLTVAQPAEAGAGVVFGRLTTALREWLTLTGSDPVPRENFWK